MREYLDAIGIKNKISEINIRAFAAIIASTWQNIIGSHNHYCVFEAWLKSV